MSAPIFRLSLMSLPLWQSACATPPPPVAAVVLQAGDAQARRADIRRQLAPLCPAPLSPAELAAAAALVERHGDAAPFAARAFRLHLEAQVCRGT